MKYLNKSFEQSPSLDDNRASYIEEIPRNSRLLNVRYHVQNSLKHFHILIRRRTAHAITCCFCFKIVLIFNYLCRLGSASSVFLTGLLTKHSKNLSSAQCVTNVLPFSFTLI